MFRLLRRVVASQCAYASASHAKPLSTTTALLAKSMPPRPKPPPDSELEEYYLKGSGPGGQKINKTSSAVQLRHIPTGIVVKSQATRSREQNRKHARELLAQKIDDLQNGDQSRSSIVGGFRKKRADSAAKKSRRKYRKLEETNGREAESDQTTSVPDNFESSTENQRISETPLAPNGSQKDEIAPTPIEKQK